MSLPDINALAQFIRAVSGSNSLGAGALAEQIHAWLLQQMGELQAVPALTPEPEVMTTREGPLGATQVQQLPPGAYWYLVPGLPAEICFKRDSDPTLRFTNGRYQRWTSDGERLFGPIPAPQP